MEDLYAFLKQLGNNLYENGEYLLAYALDGWQKTGHSSTTEAMGDLEAILKQYESGKNIVINQQVKECLQFIDEWFRKWNGRK